MNQPHTEPEEDLILRCRDCGQEFAFTVGEQQWYAEKGFETPRRCQPCRERRRADRLAIEQR